MIANISAMSLSYGAWGLACAGFLQERVPSQERQGPLIVGLGAHPGEKSSGLRKQALHLPLSCRPSSMFRSWDVKEKRKRQESLDLGSPPLVQINSRSLVPSSAAVYLPCWPPQLPCGLEVFSLPGFLPQGYSKPPSCMWFFQAYPLESCPVSPS